MEKTEVVLKIKKHKYSILMDMGLAISEPRIENAQEDSTSEHMIRKVSTLSPNQFNYCLLSNY